MEWLFCPLSGPLQEFGNDKIRPWTTTHGFFLQMGGFVLCKDGVPIQAMSFSKSWIDENKEMHEYASNHKDEASVALGIKERILAGDIDAPRITAVEIKDRSKGDALSKFLVISQTTWFTIQCIARWAARLPVTEFEIITLAYAVLNGITYTLWWNKPQNVGVPVYLEMKQRPSDSPTGKPLDRTRIATDIGTKTTATGANSSQVLDKPS